MKVIIISTYELKPSFVREVEEEGPLTDEEWDELIGNYGIDELGMFASSDFDTITIIEK